MKYKLAICKIHMIGSPALILGFCRYDDDDEFWQKFQLFTGEEYLGSSEFNQTYMEKLKKYHGDTVYFTSIDKTVKVKKSQHDFSFSEPIEITKAEWELVGKELNENLWQDFDLETWGK